MVTEHQHPNLSGYSNLPKPVNQVAARGDSTLPFREKCARWSVANLCYGVFIERWENSDVAMSDSDIASLLGLAQAHVRWEGQLRLTLTLDRIEEPLDVVNT